MRKKYWKYIFLFLFIILLAVISYFISNFLLNYIIGELSEEIKILSVTAHEAINSIIIAWIYIFFILMIPTLYILLYKYLKDALYKKERKIYLRVRKLYLVMLVGIFYGYYTSINFMIPFLYNFNRKLDIQSSITLNNLIITIVKNCLLFSFIFLSPFMIKLLVESGLTTKKKLKKNRGIIYVVILLFSAVLTPPDVVSMFVATVPLIGLFEIGILIGKESKKKIHK